MNSEVSPALQGLGRLLLHWLLHCGVQPEPEGIGLFSASNGAPEHGWVGFDFSDDEWTEHEESEDHPILADFYVKVLHDWDAAEVPPIVVLQVQDASETRSIYRSVVGAGADQVLAAARSLFDAARERGFYLRRFPGVQC